MVFLGGDREEDGICQKMDWVEFLANGFEVGPILPSRGLRQGYLFLQCAEGLSSILYQGELQ
ncbi:hypothetical protein Sjap_010359 [Stephania japonica]|uniref:Uncharacterized protein n=1 Tax=Stephania japonica TaxID=461633 RepID=A0AAP0JBG7_9MAGN